MKEGKATLVTKSGILSRNGGKLERVEKEKSRIGHEISPTDGEKNSQTMKG